MMTVIKKTLALLLFLSSVLSLEAQISSAKITYERKTNLYKRWKKNDYVQRWIKEEDKIKIDYFELFITDSCSLFRPQENELKENYSWTVTKNTVYQFPTKNSCYLIKNMWGEELHLTDTLQKRTWQITQSTRKIAGYVCRKAIWQPDDSTRIYAWFSYDITPSSGPERFSDLPGTILGIATEDGGIVYFAKKIEILKSEASLFIPPKKKKIYTVTELKAELTKQYSFEKWFKEALEMNFGIW